MYEIFKDPSRKWNMTEKHLNTYKSQNKNQPYLYSKRMTDKGAIYVLEYNSRFWFATDRTPTDSIGRIYPNWENVGSLEDVPPDGWTSYDQSLVADFDLDDMEFARLVIGSLGGAKK